MRKLMRPIAALVIGVPAAAFAQQATYTGSGVSIPAVKVGTVDYPNVTLGLIPHPTTLAFRLTGAGQPVANNPATTNVFSGTTLTLPSVLVGSSVYTNVTLTLTNPTTYEFVLAAFTPPPPPPPPPTGGSASVCLDTALLTTAGTKWVMNFRTLTGTTQTATTETELQVEGPQSFNGQNAIELKSRVRITSGQGVGTEALSWSYVTVANLKVSNIGDKVTASTAIPGFGTFESDTVVTFNPAPVWDYSLSSGQSAVTNWTATSTTTIKGAPIPIPPTVSTYSGSDTYTFLGFEDVTVPAGTFSQACKWQHVHTDNTGSTTSTLWHTRRGGTLKTVTGNFITELTSGNLNGGPIGP